MTGTVLSFSYNHLKGGGQNLEKFLWGLPPPLNSTRMLIQTDGTVSDRVQSIPFHETQSIMCSLNFTFQPHGKPL